MAVEMEDRWGIRHTLYRGSVWRSGPLPLHFKSSCISLCQESRYTSHFRAFDWAIKSKKSLAADLALDFSVKFAS